MLASSEEENKLPDLITSEIKRSTLGTVFQTAANSRRASMSASSGPRKSLSSATGRQSITVEQRKNSARTSLTLSSRQFVQFAVGRGLCCT